MNTSTAKIKNVLFPLLFLFVFLSIPTTAFATTSDEVNTEDAAPALPSAGLPELSTYQATGSSLARGLYPSSYDSRDYGYVTSVKDQDPWGACWAFGTLAAGESSLIKKHLATSSLDLSEMHLAYFLFQCPTDPLGLTSGDTVRNNTGNYFLDTGGNNLFTMFALSKWIGASTESEVPYSPVPSSLSASLAYRDTAHLQNARFVNTADMDSVKNLIQTYGAVSTAIYYHTTFQSDNGAYYFPYTGYSTNHIVSIVGWDDNYSKENFTATYRGRTIQPTSDGAWIAKNSYGTSIGDEGYIYISYEDASIIQTDGDFLSYAFDLESSDNYDHNYQYDGSFGSGLSTSMNGTSLANVYKVQGNPGGNEKLEAVSFSLFTQNVAYSIQIYKNPKTGNPTSGTPVFTTPQTGQTTYSGYYTIPLKKQPVFAQGDTFSVVITLNSISGSTVTYFLDEDVDVSGLQFVTSSSKNQSFYKSDASDGWIDLHTLGSGKTARIKAFTSNTTQAVTSLETITSTIKRPSISYLKRVSSTKVKLKWKAVKNAEKYQIYRSRTKNGTYRKVGTTKSTTFTDTKRVPGTTYYYKIRGVRTLNGYPAYSRFSAIKSVTVSLSAPSLKQANRTKPKTVHLKWSKVTGAKGYEIYRSAGKGKKYTLIADVKSTTYRDKLPKKKNYYYKVRCYTVINKKKVYSGFSAIKFSS